MARIYHWLMLLAFSLFPIFLIGQIPTDVVHLVSSQTQEGIVIEQRPGVSIKLWRLPQGDTLTFAMEDIERITRILPTIVPPSVANSSTPTSAPVPIRRNVFMINTCIGGGDYPFGGFGLTLSRRLGGQGKTWLGLGVQYIGNSVSGSGYGGDYIQMFPLMIDLRQEFSRSKNGRFSTMVFVDAGYAISITGNSVDEYGEFSYGNGFAFHPGIAFKINVLRNAGLMFDIGWMHHTGTRRWLSPATVPDSVKKWNVALFRGTLFF